MNLIICVDFDTLGKLSKSLVKHHFNRFYFTKNLNVKVNLDREVAGSNPTRGYLFFFASFHFYH